MAAALSKRGEKLGRKTSKQTLKERRAGRGGDEQHVLQSDGETVSTIYLFCVVVKLSLGLRTSPPALGGTIASDSAEPNGFSEGGGAHRVMRHTRMLVSCEEVASSASPLAGCAVKSTEQTQSLCPCRLHRGARRAGFEPGPPWSATVESARPVATSKSPPSLRKTAAQHRGRFLGA